MTADAPAQTSSLRRAAYRALWAPPLKAVLGRLPIVRRLYDGWRRTHPFDAAHGIDTSGSVPAVECAPDAAMAALISPYAGSQPTIVRHVLRQLPDPHTYAFVDLGCGKGRPLVVASELPFARLLGVEISPVLAAVARTNAAVIRTRYPTRPAIAIDLGDATAVAPPGPQVVYFMYHPFDRPLVQAMVGNIDGRLGDTLQHAFFVYYNPVHGDVLDASPRFSRWSAETVPYAADELGFGPDLEDTVIVWQTRPERYPARPNAARAIVIHASGSSAGLAG